MTDYTNLINHANTLDDLDAIIEDASASIDDNDIYESIYRAALAKAQSWSTCK